MSAAEFKEFFGVLIFQVGIYGGSAALLGFLIFRFLGAKWIENKFSKELEAYKHAQTKELEDVRFRINSLFNRVAKLHDREFQILPDAWSKLNNAFLAIMRCIVAYREYPDLDKLSPEELDEFLADAALAESSKKKLRESSQKVKLYQQLMSWIEINNAHKAFYEFHAYIVANRIFLHPELKVKFDNVDSLMWNLWLAKRFGEEHGNRLELYNEIKESRPKIEQLIQEIEKLVQIRLYPEETRI